MRATTDFLVAKNQEIENAVNVSRRQGDDVARQVNLIMGVSIAQNQAIGICGCRHAIFTFCVVIRIETPTRAASAVFTQDMLGMIVGFELEPHVPAVTESC